MRVSRESLYRLMDLVVTWVVYALVMIPLHEAFHYWMASMLGYKATIGLPSPFLGYTEIEPVPTNPVHIFLLAVVGGLGVALVYYLISLFTKDEETDIVVGYFAIGSLIYAGFEVIYLFGFIPAWTLGIVPWTLAYIPMLYRLYRRV